MHPLYTNPTLVEVYRGGFLERTVVFLEDYLYISFCLLLRKIFSYDAHPNQKFYKNTSVIFFEPLKSDSYEVGLEYIFRPDEK